MHRNNIEQWKTVNEELWRINAGTESAKCSVLSDVDQRRSAYGNIRLNRWRDKKKTIRLQVTNSYRCFTSESSTSRMVLSGRWRTVIK